jgi:cyclopropane fatty-acyl-phospholipid synthase-like methyltransferase
MNLRMLLKSKLMHRKSKMSDIEYQMRKLFFSKKQQFGGEYFYQSYPPLKIRGHRPTLVRFEIYGLSKYLKKTTAVLDIGGNTGFFSMFISKYVRTIDIVEKNDVLASVGEVLKRHEKIKNVNFICEDFKTFKSDQKYDVIFAFAVHMWVGMSFSDYMMRIKSLLKPGGIVLLESQDVKVDDLPKKLKSVSNIFKVVDEGITDDHMGLIRTFHYLKLK